MIELEEPLTNCGCPYCDEARENELYNNSQKTIKGCGKTFTYKKEDNVTITMECGTFYKEKTYLCENCS